MTERRYVGRYSTIGIWPAFAAASMRGKSYRLGPVLRIPVAVHTVQEDQVFRPSAWNSFGMDLEGANYRACHTYGSLYK